LPLLVSAVPAGLVSLSTSLYAQPAAAPAPAPAAVAAPAGAGAAPGTAPGGAAAAAAAEKKPRKFWIDGKFRELKPGEVRPYRPPQLPPEPEPQPSTIKVLEAQKLEEGGEPQVLARPYYGAQMIGTVAPGTRLQVRGELIAKSTRYCHGKRWLALAPFGWICAEHGKPVDTPATTEPVYQIVPGERVPFKYVMVSSKDPLPMWATIDDLKAGNEPERNLERGDSIAIEKTVKHDGQTYYQSVEGKILPVQGTYNMEATSTWHGILIDDKVPLPFGWILGGGVKAQAEPGAGAVLATLARRTRVDILEEATVKGRKFLKVRLSAVQQSAFPVSTAPLPPPPPGATAAPGKAPAAQPAPTPPAAAATAQATQKPGAAPSAAPSAPGAPAAPAEPLVYWVPAGLVNEVRLQPRPEGMGTASRWFDADLGEQVLVAYEGDKPVYATLVSSGKNNATPLGNYPVWARVTSITMKSQPYDDKPYFVNMVPWSTFFQAHNAIHGAYWHDRFGSVKSHGCINVSPLDARFVFEWLEPKVPPGWTSLRPVDLRESPTLHVWDSHRKPVWKQERPIGPPDREDEAERLEEAEKRRAEALTAQATPGAPGAPAPAPAGMPAPAPAPAAPNPAAPAAIPR
jgi:lipoprotein-anchoring transpeptidase ErfK/SrfK